ncbi:Polygalacturonase [Handroanthus impetiginosus]|uniref:endo-polygalacturonase n=1 Tax=Handroanthus impetiginosus TaxID=429701 RepID=A0A2G9GXW5_9LAMI|nr:Polygalacturonase [Handroanthus impetiginosus]
MKKVKSSSSSSNAFSCCSRHFLLQILYIGINLLLNVTNANGFNPLIQLPSSGLYGNISETVVLNIDDFGAKADGINDDTEILRHVWKMACSSSSPTKIVIPAGNSYRVKPTNFAGPCQSKVTLRVSGILVAPQDPDVWKGLNVHKWLYFHGVKHLTVEGSGTINGMGQEWWARSCKTNKTNPCTHAPTAITFHKCKNLKVRNVTLVNSQQMHMAFTHCMHVAVSHLTVIAPADSPNTDGIHISASTRVELKDSIIGTGDDCISIVSNSSHIRIKNIICGPGHGISIGSLGKYNSYAAVEDVIVDGAVIFNTENGVRIKTWQGGSGFARKIRFQNVWMQNVSNPVIIDQYYCDSSKPCLNQTSAVKIDSISFRDIKGTSATQEAIILSCSDSYPCTRLYLENIQLISLSGITKSCCWQAYGTSSGLIYPPSCIESCETIVQENNISIPISLQNDNYAFI